jgi:hypothetical protein
MDLLNRLHKMSYRYSLRLRVKAIARACTFIDRVVQEIALSVNDEVIRDTVLYSKLEIGVVLYKEIDVLLIVEVL